MVKFVDCLWQRSCWVLSTNLCSNVKIWEKNISAEICNALMVFNFLVSLLNILLCEIIFVCVETTSILNMKKVLSLVILLTGNLSNIRILSDIAESVKVNPTGVFPDCDCLHFTELNLCCQSSPSRVKQ